MSEGMFSHIVGNVGTMDTRIKCLAEVVSTT